MQPTVISNIFVPKRAYRVTNCDGRILHQWERCIVQGQMAGVLSKVNTAVEATCFGKCHKWLLVLLSGLLVDANHLAPSTRSKHLEVLLANLKEAPIVFRIWILQPRRVGRVLRNHYVGSKYLCLRGLAAFRFDQFVEAVETRS
jgi:hypothetical protein